MIDGTVNSEGSPVIFLSVADQTCQAIIDTGFNGDLELPHSLRPLVNARYHGPTLSLLASGQSILEDLYFVDFPFDGQNLVAQATFSPGTEILIGTHLLRRYRLEIHFPNQTVRLERVA